MLEETLRYLWMQDFEICAVFMRSVIAHFPNFSVAASTRRFPTYPVAPKAGGWNTKALDHTTLEKLIAHYRGHPQVDVNRIEEVDFIWSAGPLTDAVPTALHGTSHVVEHTSTLPPPLDSADRTPEG
jgi:hypothetical protein